MVAPFAGNPQSTVDTPWYDPDEEGLSVEGAWTARGVADYATSLLDETTNGKDLTEVGGSPAWTAARGWYNFKTLSHLLDTNIEVDSTSQDWTVLVQFDALASTDNINAIVGSISTADGFALCLITRRNATNQMAVYYGGASGHVAHVPAFESGNYGFAGKAVYRDGSAETNPIVTDAGDENSSSLWIGGCNFNGGILYPTDVDVWRVVAYSEILSPAQVASVYARMSSFT